MEREYYIVEVAGEGCYCLCYDDVDGNRIVIDRDLEIREDWDEREFEVALVEQLAYNTIMNQTPHNADPPGGSAAGYTCIETEKALSRAQGLLKHLQNHLPAGWMQAQGKDIQDNLAIARESFREVLQNTRDTHQRQIDQHANADNWVALHEQITDNTIMERLKELVKHMMDQMRADLKRSGDYDSYGEEGIRIAVYEDLKDSLKHEFSDILYK